MSIEGSLPDGDGVIMDHSTNPLSDAEQSRFEELGGLDAYWEIAPAVIGFYGPDYTQGHKDFDEYRELYLRSIGAQMDQGIPALTIEEAILYWDLRGKNYVLNGLTLDEDEQKKHDLLYGIVMKS